MPFCWWCFCLCCLLLKECATEHDSWNIAVSHSVVGLEGSCLDISCRFNYPGSDRKASDYKGIWLTDSNEKVFHSEASQISSTFLHRTSMLGDLHHRNCSLKINPLKNSDKGPFTFRIEIVGFNKYSFGNHKVTVTVKDAPERPTLHVEEEMKTRKKVTVTCSVLHSCPSAPPRITWNHPGKESIESKKQADDQWQLTSSLSFTTTNQDNNKVLSCTAEFTGGMKVSSSKILNVKYPPTDVKVISRSLVTEGSSVEMNCSSDSNPAANSYKWITSNKTVVSEEQTYTMQSVNRHVEPLYCIAVNTEGESSSSLVKLSVVYPPEIKTTSSCSSEFSKATCVCMVDSNPTSDIKWWGSDQTKVLQSSSTEHHGFLSVVTLQSTVLDSDTVHCYANNSLGHSTLTLHVPHSDKLLYTAVAASVFLVIIIGLTAWMVKKSCGSSRAEQPVTHTKTEMDVTQCASERKCEAYSTYDESHHVYGNMGLEEDNDPYTFEEPDDEAMYANV
ncbi:myelin-associated glycoprotein [Astyanax mexicanus]|uniref:myelin-associated glycoprotein n=1 Tax=Astyanax mexicanus TaxID=7994 RepID=UPI0020CB32DA|nr:myelin-associated glycoprotein [Astyanax mexicanus]